MRLWTVCVSMALLGVACSAGSNSISFVPAVPPAEEAADHEPGAAPTQPSPTSTVVVEPTRPTSPTSLPAAPPTPPPTPTVTPTPQPVWFLDVVEIDKVLAHEMTPTSWSEGCPVGLDQLRLLTFPYVDFDGVVQTGRMVVNAGYAEDIGSVFRELFAVGYPIQHIALVDGYGGDDGASMRANNTSAFNCRPVGTGSGAWSNHAFGAAIDLNPLMNPLVQGAFVDPAEGAEYVDRDDVRLGMIVGGDPAVAAFARIGWIWGGTWASLKDYQHFSDNGR